MTNTQLVAMLAETLRSALSRNLSYAERAEAYRLLDLTAKETEHTKRVASQSLRRRLRGH